MALSVETRVGGVPTPSTAGRGATCGANRVVTAGTAVLVGESTSKRRHDLCRKAGIFVHFRIEEFDRIWRYVIPDDYDKYDPPRVEGKPVTVYLNLEIFDIDDITETTMDFRMHLFQTERWKDPRLRLEMLNITNYKVLHPKAAKSIWIPDLVFDNSKWGQLFQFSIPNTAIKIYQDNTIRKLSRYSFRVSCPMKLHYYPFDIQHCVFKICFLTSSNENALLEWAGVKDSPYKDYGPSVIFTEDIQPLKYEVKIPKPHKGTEIYIGGSFSYLAVHFTFIRRLTGNIINVYVPSSLVVVLSWLSFWLDVNSVPARITLGVTSILTLITQVVQSRSYSPPVNYVKALDIWLFTCTSFVTASLIEYALAHQLTEPNSHKRESSPSKSREKQTDKRSNSKEKLIKVESRWRYKFCNTLKPGRSVNRFDFYSRFVFPLLFFMFTLSYWCYFLGLRDNAIHED
ncbi:glycine receptor subunit alpha-4-like [Centruroides sculpturatus]|uniref:glycine receptor subunit alpha-4-like n=1 Tax=Centruroides sculpturatus TaxID=218467 RepID=UPI000C6D159C|nr:glycine receptor subunit alpha-4-like [Centruroides sculpturatus]